jgi:hypothetical protein
VGEAFSIKVIIWISKAKVALKDKKLRTKINEKKNNDIINSDENK